MKLSYVILLIFLWAILCPLQNIAAQESAPEQRPVPTLDATFISKDGRILIGYPKGWTQASNENTAVDPGLRFYITNNEDLSTFKYFGVTSNPFPSDNILILVDVHERYWVNYMQDGFDRTLDVFALRQNMDDAGTDRTELTSVIINGHPAVETYFKRPNYADGYDLLIDLGDGLLAQVYAYAPPGELRQWDAFVQAVAASIIYKPYTKADLTETYTSKDGKVSVNYPKGWETSKRLDRDLLDAGGILDVNLVGGTLNFGIVVGKAAARVTFEDYTYYLAVSLRSLRHTITQSFESMNLTINSHPAQMISISYADRPRIHVVLVIDLGGGVFANIDGLVDKTRFERWQHIAMVIAETITYSP